MANRLIKTLLTAAVVSALPALSSADTVTTVDGSNLEGEILKIADDQIHLKTSFAGTIKIDMDEVTGFTSADPMFVRTEAGEVVSGPVTATEPGALEVQTSGGTVAVETASIASSWGPDGEDPVLVSERRDWTAEAAVTFTGKSGNSESTNLGARANAQLKGPTDRLRFYGSYIYEEQSDAKTTDEIIIGSSYTYFLSERWGWYVRGEGERDPFEDLDFRLTAGAGLNYVFVERDTLTIEGRAGLSYRYEDYTEPREDPDDASLTIESNDYPGLDLGLDIWWQFAKWGEFRSHITYLPAFEDFGSYLLEHDTSIVMPLQMADNWSFQVGLRQKYDSEPAAGNESTDSTYYAALLYSWK